MEEAWGAPAGREVSGEAQARAPRRGEGPLLVSQGRRARAGKDGPEELGGERRGTLARGVCSVSL